MLELLLLGVVILAVGFPDAEELPVAEVERGGGVAIALLDNVAVYPVVFLMRPYQKCLAPKVSIERLVAVFKNVRSNLPSLSLSCSIQFGTPKISLS